MVIKAVLGMTIAVCAACSYKGSFVDCEVACTESTGCPPGFTCSPTESLCRSGATNASCAAVLDGGVDSDADGGIDGGATSCPAAFDGAGHLFVNMEVTWEVARMHCTSLDPTPTLGVPPYVHLVVVKDAGELGQVMVLPATQSSGTWLGYTDRKLNPPSCPDPVSCAVNFRWITDEQPNFTTWASGQPDNGSGPRCAYRDSGPPDMLMHDRTCDNLRHFVCECDQFPENPDNF